MKVMLVDRREREREGLSSQKLFGCCTTMYGLSAAAAALAF